MPKLFLLLFIFPILCFTAAAQSNIDVVHYHFQLQLTDASDTIKGTAAVTLKLSEGALNFTLDLTSINAGGKGMQVQSVKQGNTTFSFSHAHDKVTITLPQAVKKEGLQTFEIVYSGVPLDGLIISKNKWGDRTFFADNWPNRAHNWLPCNDTPADKATVDFEVTAPAYYSVVSNGVQISVKWKGTNKTTAWKESVPIPTKVMVIGVADFAVKQYSNTNLPFPVSAWVYKKDSTKGFYDYALAPGIVQFYSDYIGAYPFEKLANVQSTTIFGGMENAGAIFYDEKTVTGTRKSEDLLAHEIAHQWFGDMASEKSFAHLWLSEGFATYLTDIYLEHQYGKDSVARRLQKERAQVQQFAVQSSHPVVDTTSDLMELLNANSYQKGAWVLHMLRNEVGDAVFKNILQQYYASYKGGNADTWDFEKVAEKVSGKDLKPFFTQWLYTSGIPQLNVQWAWANKKVIITIVQKGKQLFSFPLEIGIVGKDKKVSLQKINITEEAQTYILTATEKPVAITLDPNTKLLFSGSIKQK